MVRKTGYSLDLYINPKINDLQFLNEIGKSDIIGINKLNKLHTLTFIDA